MENIYRKLTQITDGPANSLKGNYKNYTGIEVYSGQSITNGSFHSMTQTLRMSWIASESHSLTRCATDPKSTARCSRGSGNRSLRRSAWPFPPGFSGHGTASRFEPKASGSQDPMLYHCAAIAAIHKLLLCQPVSVIKFKLANPCLKNNQILQQLMLFCSSALQKKICPNNNATNHEAANLHSQNTPPTEGFRLF